MYELYKKTDDRSNNEYGMEKIDNRENPFLNSPCLLTWNAVDTEDRYINGLCKRALEMARLRTTSGDGAGYIADDFPVNFLMIKSLSQEKINEFAEKYFIPLISKDNVRIDIVDAQRNMRNVNILPNCNAAKLVLKVEEYMIKRMQELGYTQEEMLMIQSQMCVFPVQTEANLSEFTSTTVAFADVNDYEALINEKTEEKPGEKPGETNERLKNHLNTNNTTVGHRPVPGNKNVTLVYTKGIGTHQVRNYTGKNDIAPYVSTIISNALKNSIHNYMHRDEFIPVNIESLTKRIEQIDKDIKEGKTIEDIIKQLDEKLEYEGTTRLPKGALKIMSQLDEANKQLKKALKTAIDENGILERKLREAEEAEKARRAELSSHRQFKKEGEAVGQEALKGPTISMGSVVTNALGSGITSKNLKEAVVEPPDKTEGNGKKRRDY